MTITLPKDLEGSVRAEVLRGRFASENDLVAEAVRAYLDARPPEGAAAEPLETGKKAPTPSKPIWEVIEEENRSIPSEVWDDLPADLSARHDHYIYDEPKRDPP